ncbi:DMT family transporter [Marinomonas ostreistagni]|uniref:DMT family transporter n=1 Tax=Marinomonas ostreistagni TaxID=359209 RepID=A0ABS0ZBB2_9GAMM|nr:DMT family transporter [Marinomonas ostreistagni]MBJ7550932.1 DMT family transporter [Marinomonas ostreistagni]
MPFAELSGLLAALCWTLSSLLAPTLIKQFGTFRFNTFRIVIAASMLLLISLWRVEELDRLALYLGPLVLSGLLGILIGDTFLFSAVHRLGPRRAGVLFAMNAPFSILLAWLFLNEQLSWQELLSCAVVLVGVIIAILFGRRGQTHEWENTQGLLWVGVLMGLGAALCQAIGALIAKPALVAGVDPIVASAVRVTTGAVALSAVYMLLYRPKHQATLSDARLFPISIWLRLLLLATVGMVIGMSVLVWGVANANVGIVTTLSATVPVLILPGLWITTKKIPALGAWIGAFFVVAGAVGIVLN